MPILYAFFIAFLLTHTTVAHYELLKRQYDRLVAAKHLRLMHELMFDIAIFREIKGSPACEDMKACLKDMKELVLKPGFEIWGQQRSMKPEDLLCLWEQGLREQALAIDDC